MSFSVETALKKARGHIKRNNIAAAEAVYKDILIKFPANQRAISGYKQLQDKFAGNGSFETAPPRQKLEELLGLFNENKFDQVIALSEQLLRLFPKSFGPYRR